MGMSNFMAGLGNLLEKLGELAEKAEKSEGSESSTQGVHEGKKVNVVYGFTLKTGLEGDQKVKVEPFGNVRKDHRTGEAVVNEVREPMVDVFEESDHVLVVAEMPGVGDADIKLELKDDILILHGEKGDKKYHKEVLLPASFSPDKMSHTCRNGVLEIRFVKR